MLISHKDREGSQSIADSANIELMFDNGPGMVPP